MAIFWTVPGLCAGTAVGVWLMLRARARLRLPADPTPYCTRCGYNLTGLPDTTTRCPEYGVTMTERTVRHGRPRRGAGAMLLIGGAVAAGSAAVLFLTVREFITSGRWYVHAPTSWVIRDAQAGQARGFVELERRASGYELSSENLRRIVQIGLERQQEMPEHAVSWPWIELIELLSQRGLLTDSEQKRYLEQAFATVMRARPQVRQGEPIPVQLESRLCLPSRVSVHSRRFWQNVRRLADGVEWPAEIDGETRHRDGWATLFPWPSVLHDSWDSSRLSVGTHVLKYLMDDEILLVSPPTRSTRNALALTTAVEILPQDAADTVSLVRDLSLKARIADTLTIDDVMLEPDRRREGIAISYRVGLNEPAPCGLAFDVSILISEIAYPCKPIVFPKRFDPGFKIRFKRSHEPAMGMPRQVAFVLRSSSDVARGSVDVFEIWDGDITIGPIDVDSFLLNR